MPSPSQDAYVADLFGVDLSRYAKAPEDETTGGGAPGADAALNSSGTDIYFARDKSVLTASAMAALDQYARAMLQPGNADAITVDGYASIDGTAQRNGQLGEERAKAVAKYLADKGLPSDRVKAAGHGPTQEFGDAPHNRCVALAPKPAAAKAADPPSAAKPIDIWTVPQTTRDRIAMEPPKADPPVARDRVEKEMTEFFEKLQKAQGGKSLKISDKVRAVGNALSKGIPAAEMPVYALLQDDRFNVVPAELAKKIARLLPDPVPADNYKAFARLKPQEYPEPEKLSVGGAIAKLLNPAVHKALGFLPDDIRKKVEKGIEDAVAKGIASLVDQAMSGTPLDDQTKAAIHNAVEAAIKQKPDTPPDKSGPAAADAPAQPPQSAMPEPPSAPGEKIIQSPSVDIPDVPDDKSKKADKP